MTEQIPIVVKRKALFIAFKCTQNFMTSSTVFNFYGNIYLQYSQHDNFIAIIILLLLCSRSRDLITKNYFPRIFFSTDSVYNENESVYLNIIYIYWHRLTTIFIDFNLIIKKISTLTLWTFFVTRNKCFANFFVIMCQNSSLFKIYSSLARKVQ